MLYEFSAIRPHSSPDPFGATLPPGEGIFPPRRGGVVIAGWYCGTVMTVPYIGSPVGAGH